MTVTHLAFSKSFALGGYLPPLPIEKNTQHDAPQPSPTDVKALGPRPNGFGGGQTKGQMLTEVARGGPSHALAGGSHERKSNRLTKRRSISVQRRSPNRVTTRR